MMIPQDSWQHRFSLQPNLGAKIAEEKEKVIGGYRMSYVLQPQQKIQIETATLITEIILEPTDFIFCNGFQSWTESRLFGLDEHIPQLRRIARPLMGYYGDYHIPWIKRGKGFLHSWSWTYLQKPDQSVVFIGSLNENNAFTCFQWHTQTNELVVEIDCRGHEIHEPFNVVDFVVLEGTVNDVFDGWTKLLELNKPLADKAVGWTSWYQYYTNISEEIILENLNAFEDRKEQIDFFQIDDGYQQAVGDWLKIKDTFPNGMQAMADEIKSKGAKPGLWLAPPIADSRSEIFKKHPEWLERNDKGKPIKAGYNPLWGGWYYAFDTQHEGWRTYMREVLETTTQEWGYEMLKLDFLFAACVQPLPNMTRAQRMRDVLEFIRSCCPETFLLGCGTPLASGFGIFDYCRISADIHLEWEHKLLRWFRHRERVSTLLALRSTISRWPLAGRLWRNDPDVYLLRDENIKLTRKERALVMQINTLLGDVLFTSDQIGTYTDWQDEQLAWRDANKNMKVTEVKYYGAGEYEICMLNANSMKFQL